MGFGEYKVCIPIANGELLCFNERTLAPEIIEYKAKPADLRSISTDALIRLKTARDLNDAHTANQDATTKGADQQ